MLPLEASHTQLYSSPPPVAISVPSGEKATEFTVLVCPSSVKRSTAVRGVTTLEETPLFFTAFVAGGCWPAKAAPRATATSCLSHFCADTDRRSPSIAETSGIRDDPPISSRLSTPCSPSPTL